MPQVEAGASKRETTRPSFFPVALVVLCLALAAMDLALALRNRELSARVEQLMQRVHAAERSPVPALEGGPFPAATLVDSSGAPVSLSGLPEGHATLLLISSRACDYCELAASTWERVARRLDGTSVSAFGLVLDATPEELHAEATPFPLLAPAEDELARHIPGVPAAVFVDGSGTVRWAVYGGEQSGLEQALEDVF